MELLEISEKHRMQREQVAKVLHELADSLARHNALDFNQGGVKVNVKVPDEVELEVELEVETGKSSIELEISW